MDLKTNSSNNRIYSFDIMRIIAICAVILLHISADYVKAYPNDSWRFISNNFLNSLSRFAVPVFYMISGALMLNEDKKISTKKILTATGNLFLLLVIWSVLYSVGYHVIKPLVFNEDISISAIVQSIFNGHYHMWYLFVLISLYLITPILRTFIKRDNLSLITIYLSLSIVVCFCAPFINEMINIFTPHENILLNYFSNYRMDYFYEYLTYYIAGWYILNTDIKKLNRIAIYFGGLIGFLATFAFTQMFYDNTQSQNNYFYSNDSLNVFLYSIAIFMILHFSYQKKNYVANSFVLKLSSLVFGVYLIHPIFLFGLKILFRGIDQSLLETVVVFLGAAILSFVSVFIISKIPIIKKLIRG